MSALERAREVNDVIQAHMRAFDTSVEFITDDIHALQSARTELASRTLTTVFLSLSDEGRERVMAMFAERVSQRCADFEAETDDLLEGHQ